MFFALDCSSYCRTLDPHHFLFLNRHKKKHNEFVFIQPEIINYAANRQNSNQISSFFGISREELRFFKPSEDSQFIVFIEVCIGLQTNSWNNPKISQWKPSKKLNSITKSSPNEQMLCNTIEWCAFLYANRKFVINGDFDIETAKHFRRASHKSKIGCCFRCCRLAERGKKFSLKIHSHGTNRPDFSLFRIKTKTAISVCCFFSRHSVRFGHTTLRRCICGERARIRTPHSIPLKSDERRWLLRLMRSSER